MRHTTEYTAWRNMIARCRNPKNRMYPHYGGRGIKVAQAFLAFDAFIAELGRCPKGHSLDRIKNEGDYDHGNVRWATKRTQTLNRSDNTLLTHGGKTLTLKEWSEDTGICPSTLCHRLYAAKWDVARALTTPIQTHSQIGRQNAMARWHPEELVDG